MAASCVRWFLSQMRPPLLALSIPCLTLHSTRVIVPVSLRMGWHDMLLWRCIVPMICVYAVEYHLPHRIATQFGRAMRTPSDCQTDTGVSDLHLMSRRKNHSIIDWGETHDQYVREWNEWETRKDAERKVIDWGDCDDHMRWYDDGIKHRLRLRPQWTTADAEALCNDDSDNEAYYDNIREL
ncbi:Serine/threonine-protein phosphatase 7 long form-like protein [Hordeum vulgare]|nr:Serine/threonine-protein phosphatase 7 long form-like protein [Hordeum vulgare]